MEKVKMIINHPMSKCIVMGVIGSVLLFESHPMYAGMAFGVGLREFLLALKK